jgi:hypothetical protein
MVRTKKPGALAVLQDAIEEYFPKQFAAAKAEALRRSRSASLYYGSKGRDFLVGFNARRARYRFAKWQNPKSHKDLTPFIVRQVRHTSSSKPEPQVAWVWSSKGGRSAHATGRKAELRRMRPTYTGSYARPKLPVIYFGENHEDGSLTFYVRGKGAGTWAKGQDGILGESWDVMGPDFASARVIARRGFTEVKEAKLEGYRNKFRYEQV